jgi:SPP1 gp7 family putative phage head morphogenesis protein
VAGALNNNMMKSIAAQVLKMDYSYSYSQLTHRLVVEMLEDIHISESVQKLQRAISGREWSIFTDLVDSKESAEEIQVRFGHLPIEKYLKAIDRVRYFGYGAFEIIWGEDFKVKELVEIPQVGIYYDSIKGWYLRGIGSEDVLMDNPKKFIVMTYKATILKPMGESILKPIVPTWEDKKGVRSKMRAIAERYGDVITVFGYEQSQSLDEVQARADQVKEMKGKDVIAVPIDGDSKIGDWVQFIKLSDLETEIHNTLEDRWRRDIAKYLLGADYSTGSSGSYARDEVQQEEQEKVEEEILKFARDSMQQLIMIDGKFNRYESNNFYFKFEKEKDQQAEAELQKTQEEVKGQKATNIATLSEAGYEVTPEYLSEYLGIPIEAITKKAVTEFQEFGKKSQLQKKRELNAIKLNNFKDNTEKVLPGFTKALAKQIKKQLSEMAGPMELNSFNFDMSSLEDYYIVGQLLGMADERSLSYAINEFEEEIDPFSMKFEEAIEFFTSKEPELYKDIEPITVAVRSSFNWVKKSTELEVTRKLINNLATALESGDTFDDWKKISAEVLKRSGFGDQGYYLQNIFRTNLLSAYGTGRYQQQKATRDRFKYWMYDGVMDTRTSKVCRELDGKIYKSDDSVWDEIYPPNHYQCRSGVISVTKEEAEEEGLTVSKKNKELEELIGGLDTFKGHPGTVWENIEKATKSKEKVVDKLLGEF